MPLTSVWEKSHPTLTSPVPAADVPEQADVVVVGAGITGLTTALLLGRAGRDVVVLEARHVGAGTTGRSTAKVSLLQGTRLSKISAQHSPGLVQQYVDGNHEGQAWLADFCATHGVEVQRRPAHTYAPDLPGSPGDPAGAAGGRARRTAGGVGGRAADSPSRPAVPSGSTTSCSSIRWRCSGPSRPPGRSSTASGSSRASGSGEPRGSTRSGSARPPATCGRRPWSSPPTCRRSTGAASSPGCRRLAPTGSPSGSTARRSTACTSPPTCPSRSLRDAPSDDGTAAPGRRQRPRHRSWRLDRAAAGRAAPVDRGALAGRGRDLGLVGAGLRPPPGAALCRPARCPGAPTSRSPAATPSGA